MIESHILFILQKKSFGYTCVSTELLIWNWLRCLPICKIILQNFFIFCYFCMLFVWFRSFQLCKLILDFYWLILMCCRHLIIVRLWEWMRSLPSYDNFVALPFKSSDGLSSICVFLHVANSFLAKAALSFWSPSTGVLSDLHDAFTLIEHATFPDFSTKWNFFIVVFLLHHVGKYFMYHSFRLITIHIHVYVFKFMKSKQRKISW